MEASMASNHETQATDVIIINADGKLITAMRSTLTITCSRKFICICIIIYNFDRPEWVDTYCIYSGFELLGMVPPVFCIVQRTVGRILNAR